MMPSLALCISAIDKNGQIRPRPGLVPPAVASRRLFVVVERAYAEGMVLLHKSPVMDWTDCPLVEVIPGKVSGVPLLKGTRMPADGIVSNFQTGSPVEEISENFDIPEDSIRALLSYAAKRNPALKLL